MPFSDKVVSGPSGHLIDTKRLYGWLSLVTRVLMVVVAGYAASAGLSAALSVTLPFAGLARSESVLLASMSGFLFYLVLLIWGFVERRLWRLGAVLALLSACGFGLARVIGAEA